MMEEFGEEASSHPFDDDLENRQLVGVCAHELEVKLDGGGIVVLDATIVTKNTWWSEWESTHELV